MQQKRVSDWPTMALLVIAGLAIAFCLGFGTYGYSRFQEYQRRHGVERDNTSEQYRQDASDGSGLHCTDVSGSAVRLCFPEEKTSKGDQTAAQYDLWAQQEMAEWAFSLLIVSVLSFASGIVGIAFVYANLRAVREDIQQTKTANEIQFQSLLMFESHPTLSFPDEDPEGPLVNFGLKNVGLTTAEDVSVAVSVRLFHRPDHSLQQNIEFDEFITSGSKGEIVPGAETTWLCRPKDKVNAALMTVLRTSMDAPIKTGGSPVGAELTITLSHQSFAKRVFRQRIFAGDARLPRKDFGSETRLHPASPFKNMKLVEA